MAPRVTLYTRPGCHLCDDMKETLRRVGRRQAFELTEVDISGDAALERQYGRDIPVLLINGVEAARHRIDEAELTERLETGCGAEPHSSKARGVAPSR